MTAIAIIFGAVIMEPGATHKSCGGMTEVAIQRRCNMRRIGLGLLADRRTAVMAGLAIVHDAGMIEHSADKGSGVMTDSTILIG